MSTWYEDRVFYHMYPLGMTGSPKENTDPQVVHRFEELEKWIPHIRSLGCGAIYIGPLFESSTHGYDTRDYKLVDRRLGDNDDFKEFVRLCHEADIKVVVDGVFNHTGSQSIYFNADGFYPSLGAAQSKESPYYDWFHFSEWPLPHWE